MPPPKLKVFCQNCYGSRDRKNQRPVFFSAKHDKKSGVITSPKLLTHLNLSKDCFEYYVYVGDGTHDFSSSLFKTSKEKISVSQRFSLTNTQDGPSSGMPQNLDDQVMYNPSVEVVDRGLIDAAMESVDSDLDDDFFDEPANQEECSDSVLVDVIKTPFEYRLLPPSTKVKIKLMKIMRDHNIPLVAERELYEWAIESERLSGFTWSTGSSLIKTRQSVLEECYQAVPELRGDCFQPQLIQWRCNNEVGDKVIYVRSFRRALQSLLTNVSLIKEENLSFPNENNPTSPCRVPEFTSDSLICELHHGEWWVETWKKKCHPDKDELLVPIIFYMDGIAIDRHGSTTLCPLNMTLGIFSDFTRSTRPDAWETLYFHPQGKSNVSVDNVNNLHNGLRAALASFRAICESSDDIWWHNCPWNGKLWNVRLKFAVAFFVGDTEQHDKLCGHFTSANTKMICRHCNCPRALGINSKVNVLNASISKEFDALQSETGSEDNDDDSEDDSDQATSGSTLDCPLSKKRRVTRTDTSLPLHSPLRLWHPVDFTQSTVPVGMSLEQHCRNNSHHTIIGGNVFHDLDFGVNSHGIHLASPGERLHMHQLGCAKRAAETFRDVFLSNSKKLLDCMDSIAGYYGGCLQRQSDRDFPRTNFSESIHTAKKEGNHFSGMLLLQILSLLSKDGRALLRPYHSQEEIDGRIYALELILGMEEFLKWSGTPREIFHSVPDANGLDNAFKFPKGKMGANNLDKMVVHFINNINNYLGRNEGNGNNLIKNHMYFHLSQYIRLFGPPSGWDSSWSESNHKTEVKAPAKRTSRVSSSLIKQTAKRHIEYRVVDRLHREFDMYHNTQSQPTPKGKGGSLFSIGLCDGTDVPYMKWRAKENQVRNLPCLPSDVINFCCNHVLPAVETDVLSGFTEHKRTDGGSSQKLLFRAHPSYKSDSGQQCNVWFDWAYFLLHLPNKRGEYPIDENGRPVLKRFPCQILCFLDIERPIGNMSVSGFDLHDPGYYAVVRCFQDEEPISSCRSGAIGSHMGFVRKGCLRDRLYLFPCSSIYSEVAVVRNKGSTDEFFVVGNRGKWLTNFNTILSGMKDTDTEKIVSDKK